MRADVKAELAFGREVAWFYLHDKACYFCQCYLLDSPGRCGVLMEGLTFGHRHHKSFPQDITFHHIDLNRENNAKENVVPCHDSCHRAYHAKLRAATRKEIVDRVTRESEAKHTPEVC